MGVGLLAQYGSFTKFSECEASGKGEATARIPHQPSGHKHRAVRGHGAAQHVQIVSVRVVTVHGQRRRRRRSSARGTVRIASGGGRPTGQGAVPPASDEPIAAGPEGTRQHASLPVGRLGVRSQDSPGPSVGEKPVARHLRGNDRTNSAVRIRKGKCSTASAKVPSEEQRKSCDRVACTTPHVPRTLSAKTARVPSGEKHETDTCPPSSPRTPSPTPSAGAAGPAATAAAALSTSQTFTVPPRNPSFERESNFPPEGLAQSAAMRPLCPPRCASTGRGGARGGARPEDSGGKEAEMRRRRICLSGVVACTKRESGRIRVLCVAKSQDREYGGNEAPLRTVLAKRCGAIDTWLRESSSGEGTGMLVVVDTADTRGLAHLLRDDGDPCGDLAGYLSTLREGAPDSHSGQPDQWEASFSALGRLRHGVRWGVRRGVRCCVAVPKCHLGAARLSRWEEERKGRAGENHWIFGAPSNYYDGGEEGGPPQWVTHVQLRDEHPAAACCGRIRRRRMEQDRSESAFGGRQLRSG